jgi:D-serine deaminase-like pyridoxal phosphate-dependent protein
MRMAGFARRSGVALRAHAKTHKSAIIGLKQVALGASGVCCQKISEAEAMVAGGITDILVSNQIVGRQKLDRLARLAGRARIGVCVDDAENVAHLGEAAARHNVSIEVLVEINVGANRCGVTPGAPAVELARLVARSPGLRFAGLQAYHGPAQHLREHEQRRAAIDNAIRLCRQTRDLLLESGMACPVISGAGTGTYAFEAASGVYNELQAGTYAFMDADYARLRCDDGRPFTEFEHSLFVWTTVMSRATAEIAVVDAGLKAIGVDAGLPVVVDLEGAEYVRASDEHGTLNVRACRRSLRLGDKLKLIPGNCDPTVNLHDWFVVTRDDRVEALWPVCARGPGH